VSGVSEKVIGKVLEKLVADYAMNKFIPILEADVVGYLYHLLILEAGDASRIHLDTRICLFGNSKFDIVMGAMCYEYKRPCIKEPELVIEANAFPKGFTRNQYRKRYQKTIEEDIPKLAHLAKPPKDRYILLFDENNYLRGYDRKTKSSRIDRIIMTRNNSDPSIKIIYITRHDRELKWEIL